VTRKGLVVEGHETVRGVRCQKPAKAIGGTDDGEKTPMERTFIEGPQGGGQQEDLRINGPGNRQNTKISLPGEGLFVEKKTGGKGCREVLDSTRDSVAQRPYQNSAF